MPRIEKPTEPGYYYLDRDVVEVKRWDDPLDADQPLYVLTPGSEIDEVVQEAQKRTQQWKPWLRIPPPSVLLAMEEVIAAVRKAYPDELIGFSRRLTNALAALARAEAEAKEGKP